MMLGEYFETELLDMVYFFCLFYDHFDLVYGSCRLGGKH